MHAMIEDIPNKKFPYLFKAVSSCSESILARLISPDTLPKNSSNFCNPRTSFFLSASHKSRSWSLDKDLDNRSAILKTKRLTL